MRYVFFDMYIKAFERRNVGSFNTENEYLFIEHDIIGL